jgi:hypothetical protein
MKIWIVNMTKGAIYFFYIIYSLCLLNSCTVSGNKKDINRTIDDFVPLSKIHSKLGISGQNDSLKFYKDKEQPYAKYCASNILCPNDSLNKIYVLPIGKFH